jgi:S-layer protein
MATITTQERTNILKLVAGLFNAAPGAQYLSDFTSVYQAGGNNLQALALTLGTTGAFKSIYPNYLTADEFATKFLTTVGLQANTEAQDWVKAKVAAGESFASVIYQGLVAIDGSTSPDFAAAKAQLANKAAAAEYYSVTLGASSDQLATLQGTVANVTADPASVTAANTANAGGNGQAFTLTTGQDNIEGTTGNDTVIGVVDGAANTFTLGDVINGGAGTDTVRLTTNQADTSLGDVTLNSVETFVIDSRGTDIGDIDVAGSALTTLEVNGNGRVMTDNATVAAISTGTAISLHDADFDGLTFDITYNDNDAGINASLSLKDVDDADIQVDLDSAVDGSAAADVFNLTLDGVKNTDGSMEITGGDAETFNVTVASDSEVEYIGFYYNEDGTDFTGNVNLVLNGDLTVSNYWDLSDDDTASLFTITGAGNLNIANFDDSDGDSMIDASAATGNIVIAGVNDESSYVKTGSGDDVIGLEGSATVVTLGDGDDKVTLGAAIAVDATGTTDVVDADLDGGVGYDTLEITAANALTSEANVAASADDIAVSDAFANFEALSLTSVTVEDIDATVWGLADDVTIDAYTTGGSLTVNDAALVTVTGAGTTDYAIIVDGAGDAGADDNSLNLTVNGADGISLALLTVADVETVNLVSSASDADDTAPGANVVALLADETVTLNISGATELDLTGSSFAILETVNAAAFDAGLTIDVSSSGEAVTITVGDGADVVIGSDQDDVISVGNGGNTVTGGLGADEITLANGVTEDDVDAIAFGAVAESQGVTVDVITGFQVAVQSTDDIDGNGTVDADDVINDVLDLSAIVFTAAASYKGEAAGYGAVLTSLAVGSSFAVLDSTTSTLYIDVDGTGTLDNADMAIQLTGVTDLSADNFVF